eukprot:TRINITY_DN34404_c0_g1_i1.p1 TRINITY_DN34404_c0_g1~~TRINITY_DN34404_c0_g1_i1.p1  ORF type:complete len:124 (-),score=32.11 TRINITY_DN34404_c0_g1_i1:19-339(-)
MLRSLVGSEMCIRDSVMTDRQLTAATEAALALGRWWRSAKIRWVFVKMRGCGFGPLEHGLPKYLRELSKIEEHRERVARHLCLLYTSDAADEEDSVDIGGSRILKT